MATTLTTMTAELRVLLNDADKGNYTDAELQVFLNRAYRETQLLTECNVMDETDITTVSGTRDYVLSKVFKPISVSYGIANAVDLPCIPFAKICTLYPDWATSTGVPICYTRLTSRKIRLFPKPNVGVASGLHITGAGVSADLAAGDTPTELPIGYDTTYLYDLAMSLAFIARKTAANDLQTSQLMYQKWLTETLPFKRK